MNENDRAWAERHVIPFGSFDDFVNQSLQKQEVFGSLHFRPQMTFLRDPRTGQNAAEFVGRFESINDDFCKLRDRLGIKDDLPHENRTKVSQRQTVSPSSQAVLERLYKNDFEALGY